MVQGCVREVGPFFVKGLDSNKFKNLFLLGRGQRPVNSSLLRLTLSALPNCHMFVPREIFMWAGLAIPPTTPVILYCQVLYSKLSLFCHLVFDQVVIPLLKKFHPSIRVWVRSQDLQNICVCEFRLEFLSYIHKIK